MKSITEQEIFEYLQNKLSVSLFVNNELVGGVGGHNENQATIKLTLKNPEGKDVVISEHTEVIDVS